MLVFYTVYSCIIVVKAGGSWGKGLLLLLSLIVSPPSQFIAQSPDLNQTVIDKCCKLQVVQVSESTNKT